MRHKTIISAMATILLAIAPTGGMKAQSIVQVGRGSYAAYSPLAKSKTSEHGGDQSQYMQYRRLYIRETEGQPIPTNDWWTDLINADRERSARELTGHLWSYPQYVQGMRYGLDIHFPKYWVDNGTEMKAQSKLTIQCGDGFSPSHPMAETWTDWTVAFSEEDGAKRLLTTLAHGVPFTWVELTDIAPVITARKTDADGADNLLTGTASVGFSDEYGTAIADGTHTLSQFVVSISNDRTSDLYGIYLPEGTEVTIAGGEAHIEKVGFVVVALLHDVADLTYYRKYAYSKPTDTRVSWNYSQATGTLTTHWTVSATDLRTGNATGNVLQGFIPHQYRGGASPAFAFTGHRYRTPRGLLKLAEGSDLSVNYRFSGMLPWYAMPDDLTGDHAFDKAKMLQMLSTYARTGTFGGDTYWGGKGLTQMALYMTFAREMGEEQLFRQCHDRLKEALTDWLTYTPGEDNFFFARDPRFGGLIGYNTSYDSDTYNDHHFHYGYYTLAAALLAMVDDDFREGYGEMVKLIARDYNNYRRDSWACFLRMMDPWAGHCYAGGLGDGAGNGQESTSESMQAWGGMYLLGVALGDNELRDAGIFGWVSESRATAEYWFDRHGEAIDEAFHTTAPDYNATNTDNLYNIDYTKFVHRRDGVVDYMQPWSSNLTSHGIGWWTWFGGDPVFMQGIQWMPISPALDYLGEDKAFAEWDYQTLMRIKEHKGWDGQGGIGDADLRDSDWGNVVLSYRQWSDPDDAAAIFDEGWQKGWGTMTNSSTNGITYFVTHSHRTYGDIDWTVTASIPTARVYNKGGVKTHIAYNPTNAEVSVAFSDGATLTVPARQLKVEGVESTAFNYVYPVDNSEPDLRERLVMRNLALGRPCTESSHENAGTMKENATDGSLDTRWGSEHRDGEWLQVDLGEAANIYKVRIRWEASYASEYRIELRNTADGDVVYSKTGSGKSNDWTELTLDDQTGRYVRLVGVKRGSVYGTSLYELEVYGRPASAADSDLMGVEIVTADDVLKQGVPAVLTIQGYDYTQSPKTVAATWSSSDGTFADNVFTPAIYGKATVTATVATTPAVSTSAPSATMPDGSPAAPSATVATMPAGSPAGTMTATKVLPVEESRHLASLAFDVPGIIVKDTPTAFTIEGKDQFGAPFAETPAYTTSSPALTVDAANSTLTATATGTYTVTARMGAVERTAEVTVIGSAVDVPASLADKVVVFVGDEEPSMNFDYNGGSERTGASFLLTPRCRAIYVRQLGTCGFGALGNIDLEGANMIHADIYPLNDAPNFSIHIEGAPGNREYAKALVGGQWNAIDLPVSNTTANWLFFAFSNYQTGTNAALIANVYFYTETGDKVFVGDPDARGIVSVTSFGAGITDENRDQFLADIAALPRTATAIDLSGVTLGNTSPMTITTPNNPNTVLLLNGDGGDDNAASPQAAKLTNTENLAYNVGGWILPLKATGYRVVIEDGYPVLPMNFGRCTTLTYSRTLAAGTYGTSCLPREMVVPAGIEVYQLADTQADGIAFDRVTTGTMTAYRPYLLRNTTDGPVTLTINGTAGNVELARSNAELTATADGIGFTGNFRQFQVTGTEGYAAFRNNGSLAWLSTAGTTVGAFRAYLSGITVEQMARGVNIDGEVVTGMDRLDCSPAHDGSSTFNLHGQRVTALKKGIYVINGKKRIVR